MLSCGVYINICYVKYCLDRRTLRRSSCGPLVPGEWESLGLSPCPPPAGSAETQGLPRRPPVAYPRLLPRRSGLALDPGSASPPALPEAESPLHRSLHHREADKWCHLPPSTPSPVSYSPCIPHLTSQALLSICPRHRRTGSTTSSRSSRGTRHLPSMRNLGFPSTHPEAMAGPIAVVGRQEPPLEEGVLSGSHSHRSHLSHHQLHTPDPTHLISDHRHQSSRALYQSLYTPPDQSLSGLKHSMLTHLTLLPFVYSLVVPVFRSQISTAPVLHSLWAPFLPLVPLDKVKDWLLTDKTL